MRTLRVGSLFAGIGGFDLAAERNGFSVSWQCERDKHCRRVLAHHWPKVPCYEDITKVDSTSLPPVDILCGGWPCQDVSTAGKRKGFAGERSSLFREILRLIEGMVPRPRFVVLENVPGLVSVRNGRDFREVVEGLRERGYVGCVRRLDAQYFGLAQRRKRLFFVCGIGDAGIRAVQLVLESGRRYPAPSRTTQQGSATSVVKGAPIGHQPKRWSGCSRGSHWCESMGQMVAAVREGR